MNHVALLQILCTICCIVLRLIARLCLRYLNLAELIGGRIWEEGIDREGNDDDVGDTVPVSRMLGWNGKVETYNSNSI